MSNSNTVYFGKIISYDRPPLDPEWNSEADMLGQKIFPTEVPDRDMEKIFIKIGTDSRDRNITDLEKRLSITTQALLIYTGMIGSGKSITLTKFHSELLETPINIRFNHPDKDFALKQRIIPYISFKSSDLERITNEDQIEKNVMPVIVNALEDALINSGFRNKPDWEIQTFWDYMFLDISKNKFVSDIFSEIFGKLGDDPNNIDKRYLLFKDLKKVRGIKYLKYLFTLYGYLRNEVCKDDLLFVFILIDNIDQASRFLQQYFSEMLNSFANNPVKDSMIVLALRPETLLAKHERIGAGLIDFVPHTSPVSSEVLVSRINYALENKVVDNFYKNKEQSKNKITEITNFLRKILSFLSSESSLIGSFINNSSNGSARYALWTAQGILFQPYKDIVKTEIDQQEIVRACVTRGYLHYKYTDVLSPIKNLYSVEKNESVRSLLIKVRILKYLLSINYKKDIYVRDILDLLNETRYDKDIQVAAINELIEKPAPLMISYGADQYENYDELFLGSPDKLEITHLGEGYITNLYTELYYVQEIMFDTYVSIERFRGKYSDVTFTDRFDLLSNFISDLMDVDVDEMNQLSFSCFGNEEKLSLYLGKKEIISYGIVDRIAGRIIRMADRKFKDQEASADEKANFRKIKENFEGLRNLAWHNNSTFFKGTT